MRNTAAKKGSEESIHRGTRITTVWGAVGVEAHDHAVTRVFLPGCLPDSFHAAQCPTALLREAERQLREYFAGRLRNFTIPLDPSGTVFMQSVWRELLRIPFGQVKTYGAIAKTLGNPGASRAVGMACGKNPLPLLIPCHRVVGAGNRLTGFSGGGTTFKQRLLEHEAGGLFAPKNKE